MRFACQRTGQIAIIADSVCFRCRARLACVDAAEGRRRRGLLRNVVEEGKGRCSELDNVQSGNAAKVSDIARADGIPKLQCAGSDNEITERKINPLRSLLAVDPRDDLRCGISHRVDWDLWIWAL